MNKPAYHDRPTFYLNGNPAQPLRAGGVLFYRDLNGEREVLLIKNATDRYEDIGGKTDAVDGTIYDTIARETWEETNKKIAAHVAYKQTRMGVPVYTRSSKYLMVIVRANPYEARLTTEDFGPLEIHDHFPRTIHWVKLADLPGVHLHPRLDLAAIRLALRRVDLPAAGRLALPRVDLPAIQGLHLDDFTVVPKK